MSPKTLPPILFVMATFLLSTPVAVTASSPQDLVEARHALAVSEQVLARMERQVAGTRRDPSVSPTERERLADYLEHVRALVEANRERVRSLELELRAQGHPGGISVGTPTTFTVDPVMTEADEVAALEAELDASLSAFDELLLEEARLARERPADADDLGGGMAGYGSGVPASGQGEETTTAADGDKGLESTPAEGATSEQSEDREPTQGPGSPGDQERIAARTPPDVGDGSDDDVVARQIRKAAESEPDPELRERLWEEYRKYKEGSRR